MQFVLMWLFLVRMECIMLEIVGCFKILKTDSFDRH